VAVRKRIWTTPKGTQKEAWVVDYADLSGTRRQQTFDKKRDADAYHDKVKNEVRAGTHTPISSSPTVAAAGRLWLERADEDELERGTRDQYRQHLNLHIAPFIGEVKLGQLNLPMVRGFESSLVKAGRSRIMVRKILTSLGSILADAQERGLVAQNVVSNLRRNRRGKRSEKRREERQRGKLEIGVDIPTPDEVRRIIPHLTVHRPTILTAIFAGLRASELRGQDWRDIDLKRAIIRVRQRTDRYGETGPVKSLAGNRPIPMPVPLVNMLREWKLACPKNASGLAFPNADGSPASWKDIVEKGFQVAQIAAGVVDANGKAKYRGLHALRHFYASWCLNRKEDGGLGLPLNNVKERMGHASIQITADLYGHLFPPKDDDEEFAAAAQALWR
jgi:integrase